MFDDPEALSPQLNKVLSLSGSPLFGILNSLVEGRTSARTMNLRIVKATISPPIYFRHNTPSKLNTVDSGSGVGFDRETACWSAIGEAFERYCGSLYWEEQLIKSSALALDEQALDMKPLIRIGRPEVCAFDPGSERMWMKGRYLHNALPTHIPAAMCVLGYKCHDTSEIIAQNDSTGLACGSSIEQAQLGALCEVIERDVFASNWLLNRRAPHIQFSANDLTYFSGPIRRLIRHEGLKLKLFHLSYVYGVHVVVSTVSGEKGFSVLGAAASPSLIKAIEKASTEGLHTWIAAETLINKPHLVDVSEIKSPSDHIRYYLDPERFSQIDPLFNDQPSVAFADLLGAQTIRLSSVDIAKLMRQEGLTPAVIDLTTPDVAELGLHICRVVIPGVQPLVFGEHCMKAPDQRRLNYWRRKWSVSDTVLNIHPHPFP